MKSSMPFHGVAKLELGRLFRPLLTPWPSSTRKTWEAGMRGLWNDAAHRAERYAALLLATHRRAEDWQNPRALDLYHDFIVSGTWWDYLDEIATRLVGPILLEHRRESTATIDDWARDVDLWVHRAAILAQLKQRDATDTGLLRRCIAANLVHIRFGREFFIRKAIGWALREHAKTDPGLRDLQTSLGTQPGPDRSNAIEARRTCVIRLRRPRR